MKKVFKTLLIALGIIIVLHLLLFGVVVYSAFDPISKTDTNWNNYDMYRTELHYAEEFLPSQNEFSNTKAVHFSYQKNFMLMFISKTVAVTVQYTPEEYLGAKESITQLVPEPSSVKRSLTIVLRPFSPEARSPLSVMPPSASCMQASITPKRAVDGISFLCRPVRISRQSCASSPSASSESARNISCSAR